MSADVRCGVCGESGASPHYGGVSCLSCRAHFRRVVRQNLRPLCAKGGGCVIVANGRKCCRACRYSRCLAVGMDPKLVQSDRTWDKDARPRWKVIEEKRAERSSQPAELVPSSSRHLDVLVDFEGALGFRAGVQLPERGDFSAFLRYALESDRFVDEFADTGFTHCASPPHFRYDMNLSIEEAFFSAPRRLANRTKMVWQPNSALADYVEIGLEYYDNVVEAFKAACLSDEEFLFLRMLVFFSGVSGLSAKGREFQAANTAINYTSKAILFNYAEFQGNLMFELHRALSSRPAIT
ncbi:hypothetical protein M3Y99_01848500 [Aphelenchoides fujianensis]|nr:hypothetical protein M3Y99_01848500 [Aphelenchoides fujianensis]